MEKWVCLCEMGFGCNVCPVFTQSPSGECEGFTWGNQEAECRATEGKALNTLQRTCLSIVFKSTSIYEMEVLTPCCDNKL